MLMKLSGSSESTLSGSTNENTGSVPRELDMYNSKASVTVIGLLKINACGVNFLPHLGTLRIVQTNYEVSINEVSKETDNVSNVLPDKTVLVFVVNKFRHL